MTSEGRALLARPECFATAARRGSFCATGFERRALRIFCGRGLRWRLRRAVCILGGQTWRHLQQQASCPSALAECVAADLRVHAGGLEPPGDR